MLDNKSNRYPRESQDIPPSEVWRGRSPARRNQRVVAIAKVPLNSPFASKSFLLATDRRQPLVRKIPPVADIKYLIGLGHGGFADPQFVFAGSISVTTKLTIGFVSPACESINVQPAA